MSEIYQEMLRILKKENPAIVEEMQAEGNVKLDEDQQQSESEETQEDNSQSIEAKIEREVKRCMKATEDALTQRFLDQKQSNIEFFNQLNQKTNATMTTR